MKGVSANQAVSANRGRECGAIWGGYGVRLNVSFWENKGSQSYYFSSIFIVLMESPGVVATDGSRVEIELTTSIPSITLPNTE